MKFTKYILGLVLAMAVTALAAPPPPQSGFSVGSTNKNGTLSYAIISANSANGGNARIDYLNVGSDLATSAIQFYRVTAQCGVTYTNSTVTLFVNQTNGFGSANSDVVIIRHLADDSYEKRVLTSNSSGTNLVLTVAPLGATLPGDIVYRCSTTAAEKAVAGTLVWGASTNGLAGTGLFMGQRTSQQTQPLLLEINATTAGAINVVSGTYVK